MNNQIKEHRYFVTGMHCASCEVLIEKKLLELKGIKSIEASAGKEQVLIEYEGQLPDAKELNKIFEKENYIFSERPVEVNNSLERKDIFAIIGVSLALIVGFFLLNKSGLSGLININSKSSLPAFFLFGILAGISSCAALVGGLVLSMSKQWLQMYAQNDSALNKFQPHLMFNLGRIFSYVIFGALLGAIGSRLQLSLEFTSILVIVISFVMVFLALQMLGVRVFRKFQFAVPKFVTRYVADESKFKGRHMPFLMGAFTFFLPCGFTITAQGLALISGNPLQGSLIMLFFVLGTLPMLLFIGFSSVKFSQKPHLSYRFLKVAGVLVLFFAFFNINNQLNVLGAPSIDSLSLKSNQISKANNPVDPDLAPIVNGKQVIKMNASAAGYSPKYFKVRVGVPVRWEIADTGTSGCTNAVISRSLFDGQIPLTPGQVSVKEFTPEKAGKYKFSCWMGMVSGTIEVVDLNNQSNSETVPSVNAETNSFSPGAHSCGLSGNSCGCGGGCGCGGR